MPIAALATTVSVHYHVDTPNNNKNNRGILSYGATTKFNTWLLHTFPLK